MLKFYVSKGSSALAAHILLEEVAADYEAVEIPISEGAHRSPEFLKRNPKGRIPALETPDGIITENPAILEYIATVHPDAGMMPQGPFAQGQARSLSAYLSATVHVAFAHHKRGARWARRSDTFDDMREKAPENLNACATYLEEALSLSPWAFGSRYGLCDPYLFLLDGWCRAVGATLDGTPKLRAHNEAIRARPATQKVLAWHGFR